MSYFQVIVPPLDLQLTYEVPIGLTYEPSVGQRVLVPLKKKLVTGYLWEEIEQPEPGQETKTVSEILDSNPLFSEAMRPLFLWLAQYYLYPLGQVLKAALPAGLSVSSYQNIEITTLGIEALKGNLLQEKEKEILQGISSRGRSLSRFLPEERKILKHLEDRGLTQQAIRLKKETARPKKERWVYPGFRFQKENFSEKDLPFLNFLLRTPVWPYVRAPRSLDGLDDAGAVGEGVSGGLLAEDVPSALQRADRLLGVKGDRRGDEHDVHRRVQERIVVGVQALIRQVERLADLRERGRIQVAERAHFDSGMRAENADKTPPARKPGQTDFPFLRHLPVLFNC